MQKTLAILLFVLLLLGLANAEIGSKEAMRFVTEENHFIFESESFQQPNVKITLVKESYWVVPFLSGDSISTYFAVNAKSKELEKEKGKVNNLFLTADFLREYSLEKERISKSPQIKWVISAANAKRFETLSRLLSDEIFQLNTITTTLPDDDVRDAVRGLGTKLVSMSAKSQEISAAINEALAIEGSFTTAPSTKELDDLREKFNAVFSKLAELDKDALDYKLEVDKLKQAISISDTDAQQKSFLIGLADPPQDINDIGNISLDAATQKDVVEGIYRKVTLRQESVVSEFFSRLERNDAWIVLFGPNEKLSKLNSNFTSLKQAVNMILDKENREKWQNDTKVSSLETNWRDAETFFKQGKYKFAAEAAKKAEDDVKAVYSVGVKETVQQPLFSQDFIFQAIIALIVLLAILFVVQNRNKILSSVTGGKQKDEPVFDSDYEWEEAIRR